MGTGVEGEVERFMPKKKQRRKSRSASIFVPVSALLILIITVYGVSVFTKANVIEVNGASKYSVEEIVTASGFVRGDNLLFMDTRTAERNIQTILPYISEVSIVTELPDTIRMNVTESTALATLRYRNAVLVIDSSARIVEIVAYEEFQTKGLIEIRGFTPTGADLGSRLRADQVDESQLRYLRDMLAAVEREGFEDIVTYIDVSNIVNITFDYTDRFRIILDSPNNIRQNMSTLTEAVEKLKEEITPGVAGTIRRSDVRSDWKWSEDR